MIPDWQLPRGVDRGLWDYLHNEPMARSYDERLSGTALTELDIAFAARHFPTPGRLVDLGCGTGRLVLPFAARGFECLGVDLSAAMLAVLSEKAAQQKLAVATLKANLVELGAIADERFDYAACLFSTLGMIRGRDNRAAFLCHVRRILKPGGVFVVHAHNRGFRFGRGLGRRGRERGDRTMPQAYGGADLTLHHFLRAEMERALRDAGLTIIEAAALSIEGLLRRPWLLPRWRSYGYLFAARRAALA